MKEWIAALSQLVQTTKQVNLNTQNIEKLWAFAREAENDAESLRKAILDSDELNDEEFNSLTKAVGAMSATLTAVIQTIQNGELKERIKTLKKGINRATTIRSKRRNNEG